MTMVMLPCPRCGAETVAWFRAEHTKEKCDAQVARNERAREERRRHNEEWRAEVARRKAAGEPLPKTVKLPNGRVVKPSNFTSRPTGLAEDDDR